MAYGPTTWSVRMPVQTVHTDLTPGSINVEVAALPAQPVRERSDGELPAELRGRLLFLPRVGIVVTPVEYRFGWMGCMIVVGNERYPRGGYDICVGDDELDKAVELRIEVGQAEWAPSVEDTPCQSTPTTFGHAVCDFVEEPELPFRLRNVTALFARRLTNKWYGRERPRARGDLGKVIRDVLAELNAEYAAESGKAIR